ncbi:MAG: NADH-quinone oxidoreductase subunit J, partial [Planctomycetes bacterium]|nr:NADH-quinone oxidoreductase subunit J [Planctomycetota bacterium]
MSLTTAYLLYFVFALGGAGLYFLLPQGDRPRTAVGGVLGLGALVVWLSILAFGGLADAGVSGYFYLFATIAVVAAVRVVTHVRPVYSALYFIMVVVAVAALLVLQGAEFLAVALIIIYAGAILVTYLFVIMLASQGGSPAYDGRAREPFMAVLGGFVLMAAVAGRAGEMPVSVAEPPAARLTSDAALVESSGSNTLDIGAIVMTKYVVALEIAGALLLIAMVGAIALSKKRVPVE